MAFRHTGVQRAYAASFDGSHAFALRLLASTALIALIMVPCALVALAARALGKSVRQKVREAEQAHPLVLVGFGGEVAQALDQAAQRRDELAPNNMSLPRLSDALEAAETLLQHARTIRNLDKARRKASWLLRFVDLTTSTPQE